MKHEYIKIEFDPSYTGGDYSKVGQFTLIPNSLLQRGSIDVESAFELLTGLDRKNIVHYSNELIGLEELRLVRTLDGRIVQNNFVAATDLITMPAGSIGTVVDILGDGEAFEVEFYREGKDPILATFQADQIAYIPPAIYDLAHSFLDNYAAYVIVDTDENKLILRGSEKYCMDWAINHNNKVIAEGGDPCFVAMTPDEWLERY